MNLVRNPEGAGLTRRRPGDRLPAAERILLSAHRNTTLANIGGFGPRVRTMAAADVRVDR